VTGAAEQLLSKGAFSRANLEDSRLVGAANQAGDPLQNGWIRKKVLPELLAQT